MVMQGPPRVGKVEIREGWEGEVAGSGKKFGKQGRRNEQGWMMSALKANAGWLANRVLGKPWPFCTFGRGRPFTPPWVQRVRRPGLDGNAGQSELS